MSHYKSLESLSDIYLVACPLLQAKGCTLDLKERIDLLHRVGQGCQRLDFLYRGWPRAFSSDKPIDIRVTASRPDTIVLNRFDIPMLPDNEARKMSFIPSENDTLEQITVLNIFWNVACGISVDNEMDDSDQVAVSGHVLATAS